MAKKTSRKSVRIKSAAKSKRGKNKSKVRKDVPKQVYNTEPAREASMGNKWWMLRSRHGKEKLFKSPALLWEAAVEYFNDVEENRNIEVVDFKTAGGTLIQVSKPHAVPFTWQGLCLYIGCNEHYFRSFKVQLKDSDPLAQDFRAVIDNISHIIYEKKFNGASSGIFNSNLIAYDLGLRKDQQINNVGGGGITIQVDKNSSRDLIEKVRNKLAEVDKENEKRD